MTKPLTGETAMTLEIPALPPTVNNYKGRNGHREFLTDKALAFNGLVDSVVMRRKLNSERFEVGIALYFKDRRRCDIDNRVKPLLDAIVRAGLIPDDSQIDSIIVTREHDVKERTTLYVRGTYK